MKKRLFYKKILVLLLCLTLTGTLALPAFAAENPAGTEEAAPETLTVPEQGENEASKVTQSSEKEAVEVAPENPAEAAADAVCEEETAGTTEETAGSAENIAEPQNPAETPVQEAGISNEEQDPSPAGQTEAGDPADEKKKTETEEQTVKADPDSDRQKTDTSTEKESKPAESKKESAGKEKEAQSAEKAVAAQEKETAEVTEKKEKKPVIEVKPEEEKLRIRRANAAALDNSTKLPDGEYTDFEWLWEGGTGKARLTLTKITVSGGKATGTFTASSATMSHVYYLGHTDSQDDDPAYYDPEKDICAEGVKPITNREVSFPIRLNQKMEIACRSTAMTVPHWIQYEYTVTIDETEKEQVTELSVFNTAEGLTITSAELGVMEKSKKTTLRMTAGDEAFTKLFPGTASDAQKDGAETVALSDGKVFSVSPFTAEGEITVSFYSAKEKIWHETALQVDASAKTLTIKEGEKADYSKVEAAKKNVPEDLSIYQQARVKTLNNALDAVIEGLYASEQERVDAFAEAIQKAIDALELEKLTITLKAVDKDTKKAIKTVTFTVKNEKGKTVKAVKDGVYSLEDGTYTIKATAKNYEDAVLKNYKPAVEETVTLELEPKEFIPEGTIIFKENEKDPSKTNLFNTTGMFKVVKGTLVSKKNKTTLTVSLSGQGYHYLFKGTYEEALKNGLNKKNWIKGSVNSDGKWEFVIPLEEDETFIPIIAVSDSHLQKVENGEEELGAAIFARQLVLDLKKKTLTAGDYDAVVDVTVISKTEKFKADSKGTMEVVGGPNSNNYACKPVITMQDRSYSKAFIGTAQSAAKEGAKTIKLKNKQFSFEFVNSFGGSGKIVTFEDKKPIAVAFFDTQNNKWVDYKLTIDKAAGTVTIEVLKEDEEPPKEPEKPEEYKDDSDQGTSAVDSETTLADGVYTPKSFTFSGGTGRLVILCDKLEVRGGQAYATIRFAKSNGSAASVDMLRANGTTYKGNNVFTIPVELNANNKIVGRTTAMSQPHWIEYSIFIAMDVPGKETKGEDLSENTTRMDDEAPSILGLEVVGEVEITYSDLLKVFQYEDGYYLIEIDAVRDTARDTLEYRTQMEKEALKEAEKTNNTAVGSEEEEAAADEEGSSSAEESISDMIAKLYENEIVKYLVIPAGKEVPAGLDKEVIIISQPLDKTYVSASGALEMLSELGAVKNIAAVGLEEKDIKNPEIQKAMEAEDGSDGAIVYAGSYDDWDLRTFILKKMNFAVQSSEILPRDQKTIEEDMENLVRLGQRSAQLEMAMFIDRSADETNSLAAAEWYKVYGVLFGCTDQAEKCYQKIVGSASEKEKNEAEALLKTRAEENSKMKTEAKEAAKEQAQEG